jgi:uroporphyrinogen decarboxylase
MNKIQRVTAVLEGRTPDRPPVSFWYHFPADQASGPPAVEAHLRHVETYDLDFLKIMDDNRYPRPVTPTGTIAEVRDLDRLPVLAGDEQNFGRQLELIGALAQRLQGQLLMSTTLFNPWATLRQMTVPASDVHGPPVPVDEVDPRDTAMSRFLHQSPDALARALAVIAESLAHFARNCLQAGADGIYLSVRDDWVDTPANGSGTYDSLALPGDLEILAAARRGKFNILHVCGKALDFRRFAKYPVQVLNWADRTSGPSIAEVAGTVSPAIAAGLDNLGTMVSGTPDDCAREVSDALAQAAGRPMLITPGCTFDPQAVAVENLRAIRRAVERMKDEG